VETKAQIKVVKVDSTIEGYMHTKIIGTIANALGAIGQADIVSAEDMAEVITYYLYNSLGKKQVTSCEIFSIIQVVLSSTGYEEAAVALKKHHLERKLKRSRVEVVCVDFNKLSDAEKFWNLQHSYERSRWDKSHIVESLVGKYNVERQISRMIASMVEEKIFSMDINLVPSGLIKQLVWSDAAKVIQAQQELTAV
jgi:hypothetical protein